jgi:DNA invertase Pin-like site-specific DNA recombinase
MTDSHDEWRQINPFPSDSVSRSATTKRAALYARVATVSQADGSLSIEEQKRAAHAFCHAKGWSIVAEYIDAPASGLDGNRHDFKRMVNDAIRSVPRFDVIVVHSQSRFFRDNFLAEMYRRRLSRVGVEVVSITQDFGTGANGDLMRQFIRLMDEFQSRENAKRSLRVMEENARQGFVTGGLPPFGYRAEVVETRRGKLRKRLAIEPSEAEIVRLIFHLPSGGSTRTEPAGVRAIAKELNCRGFTTRSGRPFSASAVDGVLHRTTYIGRHVIKLTVGRTVEGNPVYRQITVSVPAIIGETDFEAVHAALRGRKS